MFTLNTKFGKYEGCYFKTTKLPGKTKEESIVVWSDIEGPIMTINIAGLGINYPDVIAIKDYSENEGIVEELKRLGVIGEFKKYVPVGRVFADVYTFDKTRALSL